MEAAGANFDPTMESNVGVRLSDASFPVLIDIMDSAATLEDAARQIDVLLEQYNVTYSNGSLVQTLLASSPQFENGAVESNVDPVMMRAANQTTAEETVQGLDGVGGRGWNRGGNSWGGYSRKGSGGGRFAQRRIFIRWA